MKHDVLLLLLISLHIELIKIFKKVISIIAPVGLKQVVVVCIFNLLNKY